MFKRLIKFLISILGSSNQKTETYWNMRAEKYGKRAVLNLNHQEEAYERVTEKQKSILLPLLENNLNGSEKTILDLGCGPGRFTESLAAIINGDAVGVDPVAKFIELAPKSKRVVYKQMKNHSIDIQDRSLDVIWICLVLGGIKEKDLPQIVKEVKRILAPRGLVFMVENVSNKSPTDYWYYRSVSFYQALFPFIKGRQIHSYTDLGEEIAVISGRAHE